LDELPKSTQEDVGYTIIKSALASIPGIGGAAAEVFQLLIAPPLMQRRDEWLTELARSLHELEQKFEAFDIQSLPENELFVSIVMQASQAAMKTHEQEKLRNLRNAVLNSALPESPNDSEQQTFVRWVDEFTVWHINLLKLFRRDTMPRLNLNQGDWWMDMAVDETFQRVCSVYPSIKSMFYLFLTILKDLSQMGLIANIHPTSDMMSEITDSPTITQMGQAFLNFLESPIDD